MDHEAVPSSSQICDWPLNLSQDHFNLHQEKTIRVTMELLKRSDATPSLSIVMVQHVLQ